MIECCLVVVCFCLLHDTNLGPTLPAGSVLAFWFSIIDVAALSLSSHFAQPLSQVTAQSSFRQKRSLGSSTRRQQNNIIMVQLGSNLSTCELRNHCRSDPVQVQSTARAHPTRRYNNATHTPRCFRMLGRSPHKNCKNDLDDQT